ncbi:MAG: EamA family transporter [Rhodospirillaceae bacterium]|nr:EamA family transporter [Rhodospirillaceae bacterium]MBL6941527.1 EamA family transporter [Rhodospirillales bacterium]
MITFSSVRPALLLLLLATIWSSSFGFIKVGVETIPPMTLAAVRIILAALLLYGVARFKGMAIPKDKQFWWLAFLMGIFGNGLPFTLIGWGEQTIDSGLAAILMSVMPLATILLLHVFSSDERLTPAKLFGMVVGFCGVVVLVGPEALKGLGGDAVRQIAVASGALCYAIATTIAKNVPRLHPAVSGTAVMTMGGIQMTVLSLFFDQPWLLSPSLMSSFSAVYLGLFPTAVATLIYFHLIKERGATFIAFNNYLIPGLGVLWGVLFLSEHVSVQEIFALGLILTGIGIANIRKRTTS